MNIPSSNHFRITLTLGITILVVGAFIFLVIFPQLSRVQEIQNRIRENKQTLARIQEDIANYKALSAELARETVVKEGLNKMFPAREEMVGLVEGLEEAASQSGLEPKLTLTDAKDKEETIGGNQKVPPPLVQGLTKIGEVPFTFEVSGNYTQLTDIFLYLEHSFFVPEMKKLTVTTESTQAGPEGSVINTGSGIARLEGVLFIKQN